MEFDGGEPHDQSALRITVSSETVSIRERRAIEETLRDRGLDAAVWSIYDRLLRLSVRGARPVAVRAYAGDALAGVAFAVQCRAYGRAVFNTPVLRVPIDLAGLSSYIWIRVGVCAEAVANPGFVAKGYDERAILRAMLRHLRTTSCGVVVVDSPENAWLHEDAQVYPYVADGVLDLTHFNGASAFVASHANLERKLKEFARKGGAVEIFNGCVPEPMLARFLTCMETTVSRSIVYSPFQGLFPGIVMQTCGIEQKEMVHIVARLNGEIAGYHTFLQTGAELRMIHGAFDRTRPSTHHAYESLIVCAAAYAFERGLARIHFGPVMNETKRRMMNEANPCALYFHSKYGLVRFLFPPIFRRTKMQSESLLAFSGDSCGPRVESP